jgi:regulation of enolase protein 1 (concanavalin A-like superfamily)
MMTQTSRHWSSGRWNNHPVEVREDGTDLLVTAEAGSDAWRHTSYGFVHENEHALLAPFAPGSAVEVEFTAAFSQQFDQAGVFISAGRERWVKAGLEFADGQLQLGAVVTDPKSDWSAAPCPAWVNRRVVVRVSWTGEALTVRAGLAGEPLRFVRLAPFAADGAVAAGPFVCAPTRSGLIVPFHSWRVGEPDAALHAE